MPALTLQEQFGEIDIYLFDQLLKGRIAPGMRVLDAGCGGGRNLVYLLREGYEVFAADVNAGEVAAVRGMARALGPRLPEENFRVEAVEAMSFDAGCADVVVCNTVLHFARDDAHFRAMVDGLWRVLRPGGILFCRLGSTVGMETRVKRLEGADGRRYRSPDGSVRYLVDEALLVAETERLGGVLADPIKTTVVQDQRAMTTWVVRKNN
jgi:SAM-dependent methyltransferase